MKTKKLYLVDASAMFFRAYYAIRPLSNSQGLPTNAIYGFLSMVIKLLKESKPDLIAFCYDLPGPSFRKQIDKNYKANRSETPDDLIPQFPFMKELPRLLGLATFEKTSYEADDIIGSLAKYGEKEGVEVIIVSGDKDFAQLISDKVTMFDPMKNKKYDREEVFTKWGVTPEQFIDYLAITGDSSDNIPGVKGVGPKGAQKLLSEYPNLEKIYANIDKLKNKNVQKKMQESKDSAFLSQKLVTIVSDLKLIDKLDDLVPGEIDREGLEAILTELEFNNFKKSLLNNNSDSSSHPASTPKLATVKAKDKKSFKKITLQPVKNLNELETWIEKDDWCWIFSNQDSWYLGRETSIVQINDFLDQLPESLKKAPVSFKGYDLKNIFRSLGLKGEPVWDHMLAAYVLKAGNIKNLNQVSKLYLAEEIPDELSAEELHLFNLKLEDQLSYELSEKKLDQVYETIELPVIESLLDMEERGIKIDSKFLLKESKDLEKQIAELNSNIQTLAGKEFNVASPKQLGVVLFEDLDLPKGKKTKTGYSTNTDVLQKLKHLHPICEMVIEFRELSKLKSTYLDAIPELVDGKTGRVHTVLNQATTTTGRLSSTNPNLQNIPIRTERGRRVRQAFIADNDHIFVSADYSQIELRVLAHIANDEALIEAFNNDLDVHSKTASEVFDIPIEEVTTEQRRTAKAVNFGIAYGQGAYGLAETLGISRTESKEIITKYFQRFSGVKKYMENVVIKAKEQGYIETLIGRRRYLPEINSTNHIQRSFGERAAINAPIQGTASDIVKMAMLELQMNYSGKMTLQVHDELLFELNKQGIENESKKIQKIMENCIHLKVPLKVNISWGKNWEEAH